MSKTTAFTIIIVALLSIVGGLIWWYMSISGGTKVFNFGGTATQEGDGGFFPFGNQNSTSTKPNTGNGQGNNPDTNTLGEAPILRELSSRPVSGFTTLSEPIDGPAVRYMEQETGHIYEAPLNIVSKKRISNQTIPKVQEVVWFPGARGFIARYIGNDNTLESYSANIIAGENNEEGSISGKFLPSGISEVANITSRFATSTKITPRIFYIKSGVKSSAYISNGDGSKTTKVADLKLNELIPYPINESTVLLQTKTSGEAPGELFSMNTKTGELSSLLSNILGLSVLPSPNGKKIILSQITDGVPQLFVYDIAKDIYSRIGLSTLAEKCTWSATDSELIYCSVPSYVDNTTTLPDAWYQGKTKFTDSFWEISLRTQKTREFFNTRANNFFIDTDLISTSDDDNYLIVRNKENRSLWSVRIKN